MKVSTMLRRGGAFAALAGTGAVIAGSAVANTGQTGTGQNPSSAAPDLVSATIQRKVAPTDSLGPQVKACYDDIINAGSINGTGYRASTYDTEERVVSSSATIDTTDAKCVIVTFANGLDIGQFTVFYQNESITANNAGNNTPAESTPLLGGGTGKESDVVQGPGLTTAPDLVSTSVDTGATPPQITYTFDENLDPTLPTGAGAAAVQLANKFGFYLGTDNGNAPARGDSIQGISGKSIVVNFAVADSINNGQAWFFDPLGAGPSAQDRITGPSGAPPALTPNRISPIGSVLKQGGVLSGAPYLVSAAKQAGSQNQIVDMTFAQAVIPGSVGAAAPGGNVVAYRADGNTIAGTYVIGTSGANTAVLPVTMPSTTQRDSTSVVRLGIRNGLVRNQANDRDNAIAAAAISTEPTAPGLTDGPDLASTTVDDANNRVTYVFDEALHDSPDPSGTEFQVINADATVVNGQAGSAVVSADRKSVSVKFGGSVSGSAIAGVSNSIGAVFDAVNDNPAIGNASLPGSTSLNVIQCQGGTCPVGTPTAEPTVAPTVTPPTTVNVKTKISIKRKSKGKKYTGKVSAKAPCKAGRTVRIFRGSKKLKTVKSKSSGSYSAKLGRKQKKKKIHARVVARTVVQGTTTYKCGAKSSKKV